MSFDWIQKFVRLFFLARKTLNYIIYILVIAIIAELKVIGSEEELVLLTEKVLENCQNQWIIYSVYVAKVLLLRGSVLVVSLLFFILLGIIFLKYQELKSMNVDFRSLGIGEQDKTNKSETLSRVIKCVERKKKISPVDYALIKTALPKELADDITEYHLFERKRGNIYELEAFVSAKSLLTRLRNLKF